MIHKQFENWIFEKFMHSQWIQINLFEKRVCFTSVFGIVFLKFIEIQLLQILICTIQNGS